MRRPRACEPAQTLVEFALILPILLLLVFGLIEFALLFRAWLTVQHSAQAGTRVAITGEGFADPTVDEWDTPRLHLIKDRAREAAGSLPIEENASPLQPGYFAVRVYASDPPTTTPGIEFPGGPEARVAVDVTFNHRLLTPVLASAVPWVRLRAHSEMINERFRHPGYGTPPGELPPTILPTPVRWYIAGYVYSAEGQPLEDVVIHGLPDAPRTDSDGYYITQVSDGWSGVVTPVLGGYDFQPSTRSYVNVSEDLADESYTGTEITP